MQHCKIKMDATPIQTSPQGDMKHKGDDGFDDETEAGPAAEGETVDSAETSDSWRSTTTQERDTIVGHKLQEVRRATTGGK